MKTTTLTFLLAAAAGTAVGQAVAQEQQRTQSDSNASSPEDLLFTAIGAGNAAAVRAKLAADPALLRSRRKGMSVVMAALFVRRNGFQFTPPASNPVLAVVLEHKPELDIFDASGTGTVERIRGLLARDSALVSTWSTGGWSPLHLAAFGGNAAATELLLAHGADIHARARTRFRNTPLHAALLNGQLETAKLLLARGADVLDRQTQGGTSLHEAAFSCRRDLVDLLLEYGAELNSLTDDGRSPLSEARRGKCDGLTVYLSEKGAVAGGIAK